MTKRPHGILGLLLIFMLAAGGIVSSVAQAALDNAALPRMNTYVKNLTIVVFDVETTGFSADRDRVVELGAVKIRNGEVVATTNWLVNPGRSIPPRVVKVHGISDDMVKDKPDFATIYPEFIDFIGDSILMAHNARFDVDFVRAEIVRAQLPLPANAVIDSLKLFRRWYPDAKSHKLGELAQLIGLQAEGLHRGDVDAEFTARIMMDGLSRYPNVKTLRQLLADAGGLIVF
ncbi:MAG TPA: 3'-5' exonuclease [Kiritimatiellia bacterium]|nr:3'-5' exonuclease [Kiritimatiellia bacterium]